MADVRDGFVVYNSWGSRRPCPDCVPEGYAKPPARSRNGRITTQGCMTLHGLNQLNNKYVYYCLSCGHSKEFDCVNT